jgi:hypothetical protein
MAQNPKPTRRARRELAHQVRISNRIINEVVNEDWEFRSPRTQRKRKVWRKNWKHRLANRRLLDCFANQRK